MSTYATRLGMLKGWLLAKDVPQTILNIADEMLANEGEPQESGSFPLPKPTFFKTSEEEKTWGAHFIPRREDFKPETDNAIGKRRDSLPTGKNPVDIVNTALKKLSSQNPPVKKNRKPKANPRRPTKKK